MKNHNYQKRRTRLLRVIKSNYCAIDSDTRTTDHDQKCLTRFASVSSYEYIVKYARGGSLFDLQITKFCSIRGLISV